ncbi:MAG: uncharacterized protein QOK09_167 [Mycobacterium sp.]|jgi:TPR repeat protein|nr:uncharacterized protein [Mycobacterium sp.]
MTDRCRIDDLIEQSSLGKPGARRLRERTSADEVQAVLQRAAELRREATHAMVQAGGAVNRGEVDELEAHLRRAAHAGDMKAAMRLAELLSRQGNFDDAENWWRQIAASGNTFAAGRLGDLLANRDEVEEAEIYLRRAVEAGEANAAYNLAYCLTRRNDREAVIWWERVVEEGHAAAQQILDYLRNHDDEDWSRIRIAKDCRGRRPR